jgi:hypothetical protein
MSVGPFQQMVVPDGTITGTRLPLVLISHGTAGSDGSHFDTALALAAAGFVVVALTHTGDNYLDQSYAGNQKNLTDRPRQVSVVLTYMLTSWTQHDHLDASRVGMFGFSLGGFTTLVEVGGIPDVSRMRELCRQRPTAPECLFIKQKNGDQLSPPAITTEPQTVHVVCSAKPCVTLTVNPAGPFCEGDPITISGTVTNCTSTPSGSEDIIVTINGVQHDLGQVAVYLQLGLLIYLTRGRFARLLVGGRTARRRGRHPGRPRRTVRPGGKTARPGGANRHR